MSDSQAMLEELLKINADSLGTCRTRRPVRRGDGTHCILRMCEQLFNAAAQENATMWRTTRQRHYQPGAGDADGRGLPAMEQAMLPAGSGLSGKRRSGPGERSAISSIIGGLSQIPTQPQSAQEALDAQNSAQAR